MSNTMKKMACFVPGLGTPISLYYTFTSKELRGTALKGLGILPLAVLVASASSIVPSTIALIAGAYVYWGVISLAAGWGFLAMLVGWRAIEGKVFSIQKNTPIQTEAPQLIPNASISEVLPDMDASTLLTGIEKLPEEEKEELVAKILNR